MTGKKVYRLCLVGAGRMGAKWTQIIAGSRRARLALVVDPDERAAVRLARPHQAATAPLLRAPLLAAQTIDAVIIAVPHKYLFSVAKIALTARVHTLIEKPGARTEFEMRALAQLAQKNQVKLMVGFNYRFFDAIQQVKKIVASGRIGAINFIRLCHGHPGRPGYDREWRMNRALAGGGVLMDQGTHAIDLVNWFLPGADWHLAGALGTTFWQARVEDNAAVVMQTPTGQIALIHVSITQWKPLFSLEIYGSRGYCLVNGLGKKYGGDGTFTVGKINAQQRASERQRPCATDPDDSFRKELAVFINSLDTGRPVVPNSQDAVKVLRLVHNVYQQTK